METLARTSPILTAIVLILVTLAIEWYLTSEYGRDYLRTSVIVTAILIFWLFSLWSRRHHELQACVSSWGLLTEANKLRRMTPDEAARIFGTTTPQLSAFKRVYIPRRAKPINTDGGVADEPSLVTILNQSGRRVGILDAARGGKSRYLISVLRQLPSSRVILIPRCAPLVMPPQCVLDEIENKPVTIVLDDLDVLSPASTSIEAIISAVSAKTMLTTVVCSARKGDEIGRATDAVPGLLRFLDSAEIFELLPLTSEEKERLARSTGKTWGPFDENRYALPSEILYPDEFRHASSRFLRLSENAQAFLRVIKLLDQAAIFNVNGDTASHVLRENFGIAINIAETEHIVRELLEAGFLRTSITDRIVPEYAYLRADNIVSYFSNRTPVDDLSTIATTLIHLCDDISVSKIAFRLYSSVSRDTAIAVLDQLLSNCGSSAKIVAQKALILLNTGDPKLALDVLNDTDDNSAGEFVRIKALEALDRYDEAADIIEAHYSTRGVDWSSLAPPSYTRDLVQEIEFAMNHSPPMNLVPGDYVYAATLANCYANLHRFEDALIAWNSFLRGFPDHRVALQGKARTLYFLDRLDESIATIKMCLQEWPDAAEAWHLLAETALAAREIDLARDASNRAVALEPESIEFRKTRLDVLAKTDDDDLYISEAKAILELAPDDYSVGKELGRKLFKTNQDLQALETLSPLLADGRGDDDYLELLAKVYANLDQWHPVIEVLEYHGAMDQSIPATCLAAEANHHLRNDEEAVKYARRALVLDLTNNQRSEMNRLVGFSLYNLGKEQQALQALRALPDEELTETSVQVIALCEARTSPTVDNAEKLQQLSSLHPNNVSLMEESAVIYLKNKDFEAALDMFDQLSRLRPQECAFVFNKINCLLELGRPTEAKQILLDRPDCRDDPRYPPFIQHARL